MGAYCCCPCWKPSRNGYNEVGESQPLVPSIDLPTSQSRPQPTGAGAGNLRFSPSTYTSLPLPSESMTNGEAPYLSPPKNIDLSKPAFAGLVVDQKYSTYGYYEKKFIWISEDCKTLNMSQFTNKVNHHKEASLDHIVSIESIPPSKFKVDEGVDKKALLAQDVYLTVKFGKGGAIDLRFNDSREKNEFMTFLQIATNAAKHSSSNGNGHGTGSNGTSST